jgi:crossover junction endodeoxyribonuclease RuvC
MPLSKKTKAEIILGIDPGLANTGYGLIFKEGGRLGLIIYGSIKTKREKSVGDRLCQINQELTKLIKKFKPTQLATEQLFFCKNVKTALAVGQARGVIILTAVENNLPIFEFTPLQVKQAITSYGRADKKQIQEMVRRLLNLKTCPQPDDAADALAIAICCAQTNRNLI